MFMLRRLIKKWKKNSWQLLLEMIKKKKDKIPSTFQSSGEYFFKFS